MIVLHPKALKITATKHQGPEIGIDRLKERLCRQEAEICSRNIGISPVAIDAHLYLKIKIQNLTQGFATRSETHIVFHMSFASTPESFNGKNLSFLHLGAAGVFDKWHLLVSMNVILLDIMARDVSNRFYRKCLPSYLNFVTLHDFLDSSTNITYPRINACFLSTHLDKIHTIR
jgi:hypothetical protein